VRVARGCFFELLAIDATIRGCDHDTAVTRFEARGLVVSTRVNAWLAALAPDGRTRVHAIDRTGLRVAIGCERKGRAALPTVHGLGDWFADACALATPARLGAHAGGDPTCIVVVPIRDDAIHWAILRVALLRL